MSECISRHGEYSAHAPLDDDFCCSRCGIFDEDAAVDARVAAERDAAMAKLVDIQAKLDDPASTKDDVKYESKKSDKARKRAAIRAELDRIDADKAAKQAELDELDAKASGPKK